jgi:hypothetical protein
MTNLKEHQPRIGRVVEDMDKNTLMFRFYSFLMVYTSGLYDLAKQQGVDLSVNRPLLKLPNGKGLADLLTFFDYVFKYEAPIISELLSTEDQKWMRESAPALFHIGTPTRPIPHAKFLYKSRHGVSMMMLVAPKSDTQFFTGYLYREKEPGRWETLVSFGQENSQFPFLRECTIGDLYKFMITADFPKIRRAPWHFSSHDGSGGFVTRM